MDVNGDGDMELFFEITGTEESNLEVYKVINNEIKKVLSCYYGV